jgi:hypothetical protein
VRCQPAAFTVGHLADDQAVLVAEQTPNALVTPRCASLSSAVDHHAAPPATERQGRRERPWPMPRLHLTRMDEVFGKGGVLSVGS